MQIRVLYAFIIVTFHLGCTNGLFERCDNQFTLQNGNYIYLNSPNFPNRYPSGSSCRYVVNVPAGSQVDVQCQLEIDQNQQQCTTEVFYFNQRGSTSQEGSEYFCGTGQLHKISFSNRAAISYISSGQSTAGRFSCLARAISSSSGGTGGVVNGSTCDCGWSVTQKIAGGSEARINEYPSMGGVYDKSQLRIFCGASIIHNRFLLSAAHCFYERGYLNNLAVMVGDHDFTIAYDTPYTKTFDIGRVILHEQFAPNTKQNDIALLETTKAMEWSNGVGPVCLPFNFDLATTATGLKVDVAGWGTQSFGGTQPHKLQKATLDVVRNSDCSRQVPGLFTSQLCTYTFGKDTCQYDSGGGVFSRQNRMYIVGITSYGFGCAMNLPSISTRVSSYLGWIQSKTNANFCRK